MKIKFQIGPSMHTKDSTLRIMTLFSSALMIIYLFGTFRFLKYGLNYVLHSFALLLAALLTSFICEYVFAYCTKNKKSVLKTQFPFVTPLIIVLMCPIDTSIYAIIIGTLMGVFFGKLAFGGFGQNIFNPAATGRAIILNCFAGAGVTSIITKATPLQTLASAGWILDKTSFNHYLNDFGGLKNLWIGDYFGAIGETCTLLIFILGIILALLAVIDWYIPLTYLGTIFIGTFILALFKELGISYPLAMIANGGVAFAGFFMLTDPVTNPNTRQGKIVASIIAAFITMLIRYCAILPEGALYSILIVNILTPAIEKFFEGKNDLNEKRDLVVILVLFILVVTSIVLMGSGLKGHYNKETLAIIKEVIL